jgi:hypothetical protein
MVVSGARIVKPTGAFVSSLAGASVGTEDRAVFKRPVILGRESCAGAKQTFGR